MKRRRIFLTAAVFLAVFALAVWRYITIPAPVRPYDEKTTELTLEATSFSRQAPYGRQVAVRLDGVSGTLYYAGDEDIAPGDRISGAFRLTLTTRSTSHFKVSPFGEFAMDRGTPRLRDQPSVWARAIKNRIASLYTGDGAQLLIGILTGDQSGFSDALTEDLFVTGITHVASVSGLHVSILAGFIALIMRSRRRSFVVTLPLVFLYVAITGFTPSAVRAGIMLTVMLLAPLFGREHMPIRSMVFAFLLLCVINPYAVFEPALQLSFTSTLGLLLFAARWNRALLTRLSKWKRLPNRAVRFITASLSASMSALVFSLPFTAFWFDGASLISPLTNLLLLWLCDIIFIGGALSLAIPFLAPVIGLGAALFRFAVEMLGKLPYIVLYTAQPYLMAWLLYAYAVFIIALIQKRWKGPILLAVSTFLLCFSLTVWRDGRYRLEITALDVGQGQCVVVRSGGQTAIIDCGGSLNAGRAAARYLQSRGESYIDAILLTHYDNDHINGVPSLQTMVKTERVWGPDLELPEYPVQTIGEITSFPLGQAEITLIPANWLGNNNEQCMSVLVTMDGFTFLTTGDLGHSTERWLLRWTGLERVDVLMAGHHGSADSTSEEILDALHPQAVVISTGTNRYGHPSPETLTRLFDRGIAVYRTDRRGNVNIVL